jgi:hypothetical protein
LPLSGHIAARLVELLLQELLLLLQRAAAVLECR